jgi:hypothetical protein
MLGPNVGHEERRRYGSKEQSYADLYALLIETRKSGTSFLVFLFARQLSETMRQPKGRSSGWRARATPGGGEPH